MRPSVARAAHRQSVRRIVEAHRASNARVFGSVAAGRDTESSDLDILVDPTADTTLLDIGAIRCELNELLGVAVDVLTPKALPERIRKRRAGEGGADMSREARRLRDYLEHVPQATDRIQRYTEGLIEQAFLQNDMAQDAVIRNIEIVGEACRHIERSFPEFAAAHPELPLRAAFEMRNALAHGYVSVDLEIVWRTIQRDLPALRQQVHGLLS